MSYIVYGKPNCTGCIQAKVMLHNNGVNYDYVDISEDQGARDWILKEGHRTVPQIYRGTYYIGGVEQLREELK